MITIEQYDFRTGTVEHIDRDRVPASLQQEGIILWVDVRQPDGKELDWLRETFHFHPLSMEDVSKHQQRAKLDRYPEYYFLVLHAIEYDEDTQEVSSREIDLFINRTYLVSVHDVELPGLDEAHRRLEEAHLPAETTAFLTYLILDAVVDYYFPVVDSMGDLIDELDVATLERPDQETLQTILRLRRSLLLARKQIAPLRDALNELIREEESEQFFPRGNTRLYLTDVYDHVLRLTDFIDTYRDMISGSIEAYQSSLSNVLNINIQRLTVAATVLATATLITGFFGMNVRGAFINIRWPYTGWLILVALLMLTIVEIWYFRRRSWI